MGGFERLLLQLLEIATRCGSGMDLFRLRFHGGFLHRDWFLLSGNELLLQWNEDSPQLNPLELGRVLVVVFLQFRVRYITRLLLHRSGQDFRQKTLRGKAEHFLKMRILVEPEFACGCGKKQDPRIGVGELSLGESLPFADSTNR